MLQTFCDWYTKALIAIAVAACLAIFVSQAIQSHDTHPTNGPTLCHYHANGECTPYEDPIGDNGSDPPEPNGPLPLGP